MFEYAAIVQPNSKRGKHWQVICKFIQLIDQTAQAMVQFKLSRRPIPMQKISFFCVRLRDKYKIPYNLTRLKFGVRCLITILKLINLLLFTFQSHKVRGIE